MQNLAYLLALHSIDGLGPIRLKNLLDKIPDPKDAWLAKSSQLKEVALPRNVIENLENKRKTLDPEKLYEEIKKAGVKILTIYDSGYPKRLLQIYDPPIVLYYKGEILPEDEEAIGVVGTRKVTGYGKAVTEKITRELVEAGLTIVSGLARGVDSIAHKVALESKGRTIAVLGGGLNSIFPPENQRLSLQIQGSGAVITEFPPSYPSLPGNFPGRNRIISGLSIGVVITEAAEDSGSLITARYALEQGREVFAVPGPITSSLSEGPTALLKNGAKLVTKGEDITEEFGLSSKARPSQLSNLTLLPDQELILECLRKESKHIDEICRELGKTSAVISAELIKLEIMGVIKSLGGGNYVAF
jgi:DNA processing protein